MNDSVDLALLAVRRERYILGPDGRQIRDTTATELIASLLRLLEVEPGMRVLEVGTGSGYSGALLCHLVGPTGLVVSMDVNGALVERAGRLLAATGLGQAQVVEGDGRLGYPQAARFDRIIAWASGDVLPPAWLSQIRVGGLIVAPVKLLALADTTVVVRLRADPSAIVGDRVVPQGFPPLQSTPRRVFGPADEAEAAEMDGDEPVAWISAEWLRRHEDGEGRQRMLRWLREAAPEPGPLRHPDEDPADFRAYLLATHPDGLTTGYTRTTGRLIGHSFPGAFAGVSLGENTQVAFGDRSAREVLANWLANWRTAGRPGYDRLRPVVEEEPGGLRVRASVAPPSHGTSGGGGA